MGCMRFDMDVSAIWRIPACRLRSSASGSGGHGSDAMIKHYMARWQANNATEMAKLQPVVRPFALNIMSATTTELPCWNQMEPNQRERRLAQKPRSPL